MNWATIIILAVLAVYVAVLVLWLKWHDISELLDICKFDPEKVRTSKDFDKPGRVRFSEKNKRKGQTENITFIMAPVEVDIVMAAIGTQIAQHDDKEVPAGQLLAEICKEWLDAIDVVNEWNETLDELPDV